MIVAALPQHHPGNRDGRSARNTWPRRRRADDSLGSQAFRAGGRTAQAGFGCFDDTQRSRRSVRVAARPTERNAWLTSEPARGSDGLGYCNGREA
jgi:hypothetical protein